MHYKVCKIIEKKKTERSLYLIHCRSIPVCGAEGGGSREPLQDVEDVFMAAEVPV